MHKFGLTVQNAQLHLFAFLFAVAAGTVIGGPVGDKIGRKYVILGFYPRRSAFHPCFTLRQP
ncbi:fosmidomycin resistance protein [Klebsiella pneumoniae]|uniref:Fosmidomycin resistance protein n=1 Tax=Klebsiella pneumoniae TaxID=573 RepID=A0A2X3CK20_KLEPN|nr:fosmidomycin resistance protein [Klebsiella pneumoniae]